MRWNDRQAIKTEEKWIHARVQSTEQESTGGLLSLNNDPAKNKTVEAEAAHAKAVILRICRASHTANGKGAEGGGSSACRPAGGTSNQVLEQLQ